MKKSLMLVMALVLALSTPCFANEAPKFEPHQKPPIAGKNFKHHNPEAHAKMRAEFESRLNLTEEQKTKAKELREASFKEMKPVMDAIKAKKEEIEAIKRSRMATQAQEEEIQKAKSEIKELHKKAHDIRVKNMKEFEALLTKKQAKELKKMKEEGRKKFEKSHPRNPHPKKEF